MIELNPTFLADLKLRGFRYMVYVGKGDHGVLHPLKEPAPEMFILSMNAWQISIHERELEEMASSEDVIDFKFYVDEGLFSNDN